MEINLDDNQLLKDLFDHAHDLIQIIHLDGTLIYVNKSWSDHLEYDRVDIVGQSIYSFISEPDRLPYREYRDQVIKGNIQGESIIFNLISKSGKTINVEGIVTVKNKDGKPQYTRGIFREISARIQNEAKLKQLNEELKERESNLQQLLNHAPDAVVVINKESFVRLWNPKAEDIFGWREEEVINKPLHSFIIPVQYREAHAAGMKRYLSTGSGPVLNKTIEITALRKDGEEFYISLTISPTSQNGDIAFVAFIRDITEQKLNQIELENKTRELEQFAYVSHHDLQEPLRKILMFSSIIKSEGYEYLPEASRKKFDKIIQSSERMSTTLRDILTYASLEKKELFSQVSLDSILSVVLMDLEFLIGEKGAQIISDPLPTISAIPEQMHQLFYNLLNNALKFSKPGKSPNIRITCHLLKKTNPFKHPAFDQVKSYFEIAVTDNGIGFNNEASDKIFGMFQRLHNKDSFPGTGIGLALCKKVVAKHNGHISAESEPDKGTTFTLLLPVS